MSAISYPTALEIFTNPYNLLIAVGREREDGGNYGIVIGSGVDHDFEILIVSQLLVGSQEEAASVAGNILRTIQQELTKLLQVRGQKVNQSRVLTPGLIDRIVEELKWHERVETGKMLANVG